MSEGRRAGQDPTFRRGFTVVELTVVLLLAGLGLGFAGLTFSGYFQRSSARRAAQVFAQDLALARSSALRSKESVVIRFYEASRWYHVVDQGSGTELVTRRFGVNADVPLSALDSQLRGDTVVFGPRGVAAFETTGGATLGEVRFRAGSTEYSVFFNGLGASKVEERVTPPPGGGGGKGKGKGKGG